MYKETFTITLSEVCENHVGMQKIGVLGKDGYSLDDLNKAKKYFEDEKGLKTELFDLKQICLVDSNKDNNSNNNNVDNNEEVDEKDNTNIIDLDEINNAYILVIRNGLSAFCDPNLFHEEQKKLDKDKKALMYGRVVNKNARHNLCFSNVSQEPDYEKGKGRIIAFKDVPLLDSVRNGFGDILGDKGKKLVAEGNYYFDKTCGIGYHGDAERKRVIAIRTGCRMNICYQWFHDGVKKGKRFQEFLNHGDIYIMSEFAVGWNWKKKKIYTLRHAAGASKFTVI
ncbi:hypothetical protein DICPUDRAFT_41242 [Dictyostelium purpureum]|uniref:Uncharacterized protein n=1 Tax=Dictyostelium purpureum TaxID=5786 RepID=F0ZZN5_DICPU|nr:uncharacterized protein DICPUDRAFT_41242 [Dictyostelium purpureum]EGC30588.1 hypothetical protein DICPUDRAFT_41242 [Dictyostelium purpureum]|eukprot:XP_003292876.1 hypothetical protein DICPUDRAFT_41242 [Dictyostelium purpureum]